MEIQLDFWDPDETEVPAVAYARAGEQWGE